MNAAGPLVSIITPVHNGSKYLEKLIDSVAAQDYPEIEHVVIDDGSTDGGATVEVLERSPQVRWWSQPQAGQYETMNAGLRAARGDLVCFINADDMLAPKAVSRAVEFLIARPSLDGVYGTFQRIDDHGDPHRAQPLIGRAPLSMYAYFTFITHCSLFVGRSSLIENGLFFDPTLQFLGDYEWMLRLIEGGHRLGFLNHNLSLIRYHPDQSSNRFIAEIEDERRSVFRRMGVNYTTYIAAQAAIYWVSAAQRLGQAFLKSGLVGAIRLILDWKERRKSA